MLPCRLMDQRSLDSLRLHTGHYTCFVHYTQVLGLEQAFHNGSFWSTYTRD
ncbi:hypothetical protein CCHL11_09274 [Colletotrichum chlorophyti]|uniref:Uncharacterized protein n=1 Tax=Colletotrichum chlorophyti TaxID=708187 RepID=A0A1Q8RCE8_9PEZI|nr:hypothetical protein CCHL11_09274 [Colletotrichum chlorophyti]